ncbi:hypothetical protein SCE1572_18005 [Sorangium cellulosum So0157-2]|uniref:Uncharacterized protein n=1 Tax=Sorangium cellulosum So0157-2 TaxID=1254432 RepID=S4XSQ0_SORCE|nr:hypothetical protein SCE1572_18005 [Sorangium cellulosum So0157-2]
MWQRRFCPRAVPKSMIFTSPAKPSITFWGDRSRWTMPSAAPDGSLRSCTWASASAIIVAIATASAQSKRCPSCTARARTSPRLRPSTCSTIAYGSPVAGSTSASMTCATPECWSCACTRASSRKRAM